MARARSGGYDLEMKTLALGCLLLAGGAFAADRSSTFKVSGFHSKGDALKAEAAARSVKGVKTATADAKTMELQVVFDDAAASLVQVQKAVAEAGYEVQK